MTEDPNSQPSTETKGDEIANYYDDVKKMDMQGYEAGIKKARNALYVTALLILIGELISASAMGIALTPMLIGVALFESGIFVALALWTKTKPYTAIIVGLIVFILMWVISIAVLGGKAAYSGIIVRIVIISYLVSALKPAKAWEETKKTL
jgi:hypothetical protein